MSEKNKIVLKASIVILTCTAIAMLVFFSNAALTEKKYFHGAPGDYELEVCNVQKETKEWQRHLENVDSKDTLAFSVHYKNEENKTAKNPKIRLKISPQKISDSFKITSAISVNSFNYHLSITKINLTSPQQIKFRNQATWYAENYSENSLENTIPVIVKENTATVCLKKMKSGHASSEGFVIFWADVT